MYTNLRIRRCEAQTINFAWRDLLCRRIPRWIYQIFRQNNFLLKDLFSSLNDWVWEKKLLHMFFAKLKARIHPLFLCLSYVAISNTDRFATNGSTFWKYTVLLCILCVQRVVVENVYYMIMYRIFELNQRLWCSPQFANFLSLMV